MELVHSLDTHKRNQRTARKRTNGKTHIQTNVVVRRTEVYEVACTYRDDTTYGNHPQQAALNVEYHREAHSRDSCCGSIRHVVVVRNHRYGVELRQVEMRQLQEEGYTERHCHNHKERIDGSRQSHLYIVVEHIVNKVYQRHTRHDEQRTCQQRMQRSACPRRRQPHCEEGKQCRHESGYGDAHIVVEALAQQPATQVHTHGSGKRRIEESGPVATELNTESATGKTCTYSYLQRGIVALACGYSLKFLGILLDGVVFGDGFPRKLRDERDAGHVDAVLGATLELCERVLAVTEVHHKHIELYIHMQMLFWQTEECGNTVHVANDTVSVGSTFYK